MAPIFDTQVEFAAHIGVSQPQVHKYLRDGLITRRADGKIARDQAQQALAAAGLPKKRGRPPLLAGDGVPGELTQLRARGQALKNDRLELENERLRGKLVDLEGEVRDIESWSRDQRDDLLGLADQHADDLAAEANWEPRAAHAFLDRILRAHCERMAAHAFALTRALPRDDADAPVGEEIAAGE